MGVFMKWMWVLMKWVRVQVGAADYIQLAHEIDMNAKETVWTSSGHPKTKR